MPSFKEPSISIRTKHQNTIQKTKTKHKELPRIASLPICLHGHQDSCNLYLGLLGTDLATGGGIWGTFQINVHGQSYLQTMLKIFLNLGHHYSLKTVTFDTTFYFLNWVEGMLLPQLAPLISLPSPHLMAHVDCQLDWLQGYLGD